MTKTEKINQSYRVTVQFISSIGESLKTLAVLTHNLMEATEIAKQYRLFDNVVYIAINDEEGELVDFFERS